MIETDAPPPPSASVGERPRRTTKALPPKHRAPANSWSARLRTLWIRVVPLLLLLLGAEIRIRQWLGGRSLWLDESLIARSIVNRSYGDLLIEPLFHNQAAPLGWLWAERLCVDLFGRDERSLRIVPLLAGLGTLFLTWRLARRLLPPGLVPVAVGLVALAPNLVYYGNEVKQYSSDVLVVLVIIAMALRIPAPVNVGRPLVRFTLFAVAAVWLSHAAVFALAGTSLVLALRPLADRDVLRSLRVSVVLSPWLASLGLADVTVLARLRETAPLADYWAYSFPDSGAVLPSWLVERGRDLTLTPLDWRLPAVVALLLVVGVVRHIVWSPTRAALLTVTVLPALVAGALSLFPFAARLALWLVPLATLVIVAALPTRLDLRHLPWLVTSVAALTLVTGPAAAEVLPQAVAVKQVEELGPVLEELARQRQPGDAVFVDIAAKGAFDYYSRPSGVSRDGLILFATRPPGGECLEQLALETARFATERVWVVFSHQLADVGRLGTREDLLSRIRTVTVERSRIERHGAVAHLFDPSAGEPSRAPFARNEGRCLTVVRSPA